jgi:hypothetical protein
MVHFLRLKTRTVADYLAIWPSGHLGCPMNGNGAANAGMLLSDVSPERVQWLWPRRIPLGKITILDGDPGLGKSLITLDVAARVTRNREMPDGTPGAAGGVVLASAEDGLADTVRPRLDAAGADVTRVLDLTFTDSDRTRLLQIPNDLARLEEGIRRVGAVLVIIDPVYSFLSGAFNTDKDSQVRQALTPLAKLAERMQVAVILVRHLNKSEQTKAIYRGGGSIGFIGLARSGLLVAKSRAGEELVLVSTKSNLAPKPPALRYCLKSGDGEWPTVEWLGSSIETADELLAPVMPPPRASKTQAAADFLCKQLSAGPVSSKVLEAAAAESGISTKTYQRARELAGVQSYQTREGWVSELETQIVRESDSHIAKESVNHFEEVESRSQESAEGCHGSIA